VTKWTGRDRPADSPISTDDPASLGQSHSET